MGTKASQLAAGLSYEAYAPTSELVGGGFSSLHTGGANFAFGDGSIRFLSQSISPILYQKLGNRHEGQMLDLDGANF